MKAIMRKTTLREVKASFGRYVAILAIVALGVGFFSGLKVCKSAMIETANQYFNDTNFYDYRLISTLGFTKEDVEAMSKQNKVVNAQGAVYQDFLYLNKSGEEGVLRAHSITDGINDPVIISGRMPETDSECVVDSFLSSEDMIGDAITISDNNDQDTKDMFTNKKYTIVGIVKSPYYINFERGNTSIGTGKINGFVYMKQDAFQFDYFMEIFLKTDTPGKIYSDEYQNNIDALTPSIKSECKKLVADRYDTVVSDANEKITDAKNELEDKKQEALTKLQDAKQELIDGATKLADGEKAIADAKAKLVAAEQKIADNEKTLNQSQAQLDASATEYNDSKAQFDTNEQQSQAAIQAGLYSTEEATVITLTLDATRAQLATAAKQIATGQATLDSGKAQLVQAKKELADGKTQLTEKEAELADAKTELADGNATYEDSYAEYETQIADAQTKIDDAQKEVDDIKEPDYYVLGRDTNIGYMSFENDSNIVEGIANVFPIFFFLVAALVCITTMNRMVEEQRTQIGVLKALGYSKTSIMGKYMYYSGSAAIIGCISGYIIGTVIFPLTIWKAYEIMYNISDIHYVFDLPLAIVSIIVACLCSFGTTYISCRYELFEVPAQLIRPKAPKNGKRILLERIPLIWNHLKFLHKVSLRNVMRYKRRFFMMVLGIGGCTALLVTGFGIKDSIANVAGQQFDEIQIYDINLTLNSDISSTQKEELDKLAGDTFTEYMYFSETSMDLIVKNKTKAINVVIPQDMTRMDKFINLHTTSKEKLPTLGENEIILSKKLCDTYGLKVGDTITLRDSNMQEFSLKLIGISENYIYNYGYFSADTYSKQAGTLPEFKSIYGNTAAGTDIHQAAASLMKNKNVTNSTISQDIKERFTNMMASLDYVVLLVILSAGALAFIVLYNLTNINITERIREIATIKVLGFLPMETVSYVFRENFLLTVIGTGVGLILGHFLHQYVMYNINVDVVTFDVHIKVISFVYGVLLTFFFALFVNVVMYFRLDKINMAESLKSIE